MEDQEAVAVLQENDKNKFFGSEQIKKSKSSLDKSQSFYED